MSVENKRVHFVGVLCNNFVKMHGEEHTKLTDELFTYFHTSKTSATTEATGRRTSEANTAACEPSAGCQHLHSFPLGSGVITSTEVV